MPIHISDPSICNCNCNCEDCVSSSGGEGGDEARKKRGNLEELFGEGDEARKKRGSCNSEEPKSEHSKKVRSENIHIHNHNHNHNHNNDNSSDGNSASKTALQKKKNTAHPQYEMSTPFVPPPNEPPRDDDSLVWDLESALLYLVQVGKPSSTKENTSNTSAPSTNHPNTVANNTKKGTARQEQQCEHEYLTLEKNSWITFRAAHAGDASSIAQWYLSHCVQPCPEKDQAKDPQAKNIGETTLDTILHHNTPNFPQNQNEAQTEERSSEEAPSPTKDPERNIVDKHTHPDEPENDREIHCNNGPRHCNNGNDDSIEERLPSLLQLEHWLAEGLGDENTCPSMYGLLAYVHRQDDYDANHDDSYSNACSSSSIKPTAVVLLSLSWACGNRNLRIEWMSTDDANTQLEDEAVAVRHKVWLRIHILAAMTACQAIAMGHNACTVAATRSASQQQVPHAEYDEEAEEEPLDNENGAEAISTKGSK